MLLSIRSRRHAAIPPILGGLTSCSPLGSRSSSGERAESGLSNGEQLVSPGRIPGNAEMRPEAWPGFFAS